VTVNSSLFAEYWHLLILFALPYLLLNLIYNFLNGGAYAPYYAYLFCFCFVLDQQHCNQEIISGVDFSFLFFFI
jgi:hypothetical protein